VLWPLTEGRRISKIRYLVRHDAGEIEVDVSAGDLGELATQNAGSAARAALAARSSSHS
jgi:CYTH domain-containing protein